MSTPPFNVSKDWQEAMAIVSVRAGMLPHEILSQYYSQQPLQKGHNRTDVDLTSAMTGDTYDINAVTIHYEDNDPSKISSMIIIVLEKDLSSPDPIVRVVTNTSINHVLVRQTGINCPLWLKVHTDTENKSSPPYDLIPCCASWVDDLDINQPISSEEKKLPEVIARAFKFSRSINLRRMELDKKLEEMQKEVQELKRLNDIWKNSGYEVREAIVAKPGSVSGRRAGQALMTPGDCMLIGVICILLAIIMYN